MSTLSWQDKLDLVMKWVKDHDGKWPTVNAKNILEKKLYGWIRVNKCLFRYPNRYSKNTKERMRILSEIEDWDWGSGTANTWDYNFNKYLKKGLFKPFASSWLWANSQRKAYSNGLLSVRKINKLEGVEGWTWDIEGPIARAGRSYWKKRK